MLLFRVLFALALIVLASTARADTIEAEEIEVPPPDWSVFFEETPSEPPVYLPPVAEPDVVIATTEPGPAPEPEPRHGRTTSIPPVIVGPPPDWKPWCWFRRCGGRPGRPGGDPPAPAVPEPSSALLFAVGLSMLWRVRR